MGVALIIIVIAEIIGAKSGIGFLIWNSWQVFQVEKMYVGLMVSALLGFGTAALLNVVERRLIPWKSGECWAVIPRGCSAEFMPPSSSEIAHCSDRGDGGINPALQTRM